MTPVEFFADHTYRMVFAGTSTIGLVAGVLGAFSYLRKQSLISDVISHAALPGALGAFLVAVTLFGTDGRNLVWLMLGAVLTGSLAVGAANRIASVPGIRIDTAMAITLTVFFGAGMLLLRIIADGAYPGKGGIQDYLFGNATVITGADLAALVTVAGLALALVVVFWKEFALRTFDPDHSTFLGFHARAIDAIMFTTIVLAVVIGVKAVGLVLMVALVVTPAAAARQWTSRLPTTVALAGVLGALGSGLGAYLSVNLGAVPPGPVIVLTLFAVFTVSLLLAPGRSVVHRVLSRRRLKRALVREFAQHGGAAP